MYTFGLTAFNGAGTSLENTTNGETLAARKAISYITLQA